MTTRTSLPTPETPPDLAPHRLAAASAPGVDESRNPGNRTNGATHDDLAGPKNDCVSPNQTHVRAGEPLGSPAPVPPYGIGLRDRYPVSGNPGSDPVGTNPATPLDPEIPTVFGTVLTANEELTAAAILRTVGRAVPLSAAAGGLPRRVGRGPMVVTSTPDQVAEAKAFTARIKAGEVDRTKDRARSRSTVFSLQQFRLHPHTGEVMWTQEQADALIADLKAAGVLEFYAFIWQDSDLDEDGQPVPLHMHMVIKLKSGSEKSIRWIADHAHIPSSRVQTPKEWALANGGTVEVGPKAAARAFWDFAAYLTHESPSIYPAGSNDGDTGTRPQPIKPPMPFKNLYPRDEVVANFDFDALMRAGRPAVTQGSVGGRAASSMTARKQELRRLIGQQGWTLEQASAFDYDAYADDDLNLRRRRADWLGRSANRPVLGNDTHRKGVALFVGKSRAGKDVLASETAAQMTAIAAIGGMSWSTAYPGSEHSLESLRDGQYELVLMEDVGHTSFRTNRQALKFLDANHATEEAARNIGLPALAPRGILMTTSVAPVCLALSVKAHKEVTTLAENYLSSARQGVVDVTEFMTRIGYIIEVTKPADIALDDIVRTRAEMLVSISRVLDSGVAQTMDAVLDEGLVLGPIRTRHTTEPVAVIRGCDDAARFIAITLLSAYSPALVATLDGELMAGLSSERDHLTAAHRPVADALARDYELACLKELGTTHLPSLEHFRDVHFAGLSTPSPLGLNVSVADDGRVLCTLCGRAREAEQTRCQTASQAALVDRAARKTLGLLEPDHEAALAARGIRIIGPVRSVAAN